MRIGSVIADRIDRSEQTQPSQPHCLRLLNLSTLVESMFKPSTWLHLRRCFVPGVAVLMIATAATASAQTADGITYPQTRKVDVRDDYFGRFVDDPYRWLEDTESDQTADWIKRQNALTRSVLDALDGRDAMIARLKTLWNYERYALPISAGDRYVFFYNDGLSDQSTLYRSDTLDGPRTALIDPAELSDDGTVALASVKVSPDGRYVAYAVADGGSDWRTWRVREIASGRDTDDVIRWSKFSDVAWDADSSGFYYARYDEPSDDALLDTNENQRLMYHRLGDDPANDRVVYQNEDHPKWGYQPEVTDDGRFLVINIWKGSEPKAQIYVLPLQSTDASVVRLIDGFDANYVFIGNDDDNFYMLTDADAPRRRVIAIPIASAVDASGDAAIDRTRWKTVFAAEDVVFENVSLFGDTFYVQSLRDARSEVLKYDIGGRSIGAVELPGLGSVTGFEGDRDADETFFSFENYIAPPTLYRVDLNDDSVSIWQKPDIDLQTDAFVTEQIFATSKDGTRVPVTVTRRRDCPMDGSTPTLLYGYGGFEISILPKFSPGVAGWIDDGNVYAVATLRGGGEYGTAWHEAGMRLGKQRVFDDFIAAAEGLIDAGYCRRDTLGIHGRSNGGLLVGAVMTQRPDLFAAAIPTVGVMDMLRYQKFTIGWAWTTEFGSSDQEDQIDNLLSYSPLHNIRTDVCYPATLITTADRDDRVVPGHSFKFAATLQNAQQTITRRDDACQNPVLIRIETRAGHGAGTPVSKLIDEYADRWTFLKAYCRGD